MKKAVFIDKDGTLIKDVSHNVNVELIEFEPYVLEALPLLQKHGYLIVIITNQSGIAFEYFTEDDLRTVHAYIENVLDKEGIYLNGFYYCPHHLSGKSPRYSVACNCRKPAPGLLFKAAEELQIDLSRSWMIGDILNDVEAGNMAGCKTILIDNGNETEWLLNESREPLYVVKNLMRAAEIIIDTQIEVN